MKNAIKAGIVASVLAASPAIAEEERLAKITFVAGDNGGALTVAESIYGRAATLETSIVDVDDDGNAEIAVKFAESCDGSVCAMVILKFDEAQWKPIIEDIATSLIISNEKYDGYKTIISEDTARWNWDGSRYFPKPIVETWSTSMASSPISATEAEVIKASNLSDPQKVSLEAGDGTSLSIISSQSQFDCFQVSICPADVFVNGQYFGQLSSLGGTIGIGSGRLYTIDKDGYSKYAFLAQSLKKIDTKRAGTRISGYQ